MPSVLHIHKHITHNQYEVCNKIYSRQLLRIQQLNCRGNEGFGVTVGSFWEASRQRRPQGISVNSLDKIWSWLLIRFAFWRTRFSQTKFKGDLSARREARGAGAFRTCTNPLLLVENRVCVPGAWFKRVVRSVLINHRCVLGVTCNKPIRGAWYINSISLSRYHVVQCYIESVAISMQ